jgi:hypothetical protein
MDAARTDQRARAQAFVERDWYPFPVEYGGKRPGVGIKWGTATASKPTPKMLDLWFGRDPMNIGIAARPSRLVILDEDQLGAMEQLCEAYGQPMPQTYRVRTAKGWHWYFTAPQHVEIGNSPGVLKDFGFDVRGGRGDGGYVVAAGSLHETGHIYTAEDDDADAVEMPWWIVELLIRRVEASVEEEGGGGGEQKAPPVQDERRPFTIAEAAQFVKPFIDALKAAGKGEINEALNTAARTLAHFGPEFWTRGQAEKRLMQYQLRDWHDQDESAARTTIRSAYEAQERDRRSGQRDQAGRLLGWVAELVHDDPLAQVEQDIPSSWLPLDLDALWDNADVRKLPTILYRTDKHAMFYKGETHSVHGESESGKSWVAQVAAIEVLRSGGLVLYLDYESDEREILARLRTLGLERKWLARFYYVKPDGPRDAYFATLLTDIFDLCVIDGVTAALATEPDTKSNDNDAVTVWDKALPRRIAKSTGAAVVMVDHVVKAQDGRGRFAVGAQAKMSNVSGSAFYVDVESVLRVGQVGVLRIYVAKDRPSGVREHAGPMRKDRLQAFARFVFDSRAARVATELVPWGGSDEEIEPDASHDARTGPLWWERRTEDLPEVAQALAGPGAPVARDIWRLLDHIADPDGRTLAQVKAMLDERQVRAGAKAISRTTYYRAVAMLKESGLVGDGDRLCCVSAQ